MTRADIIAALKAATRGSIELDEQVHFAIHPSHTRSGRIQHHRVKPNGSDVMTPFYTDDLNAATSLVPVYCSYTLGHGYLVKGMAQLHKFGDGLLDRVYANSPALALCIAVLELPPTTCARCGDYHFIADPDAEPVPCPECSPT